MRRAVWGVLALGVLLLPPLPLGGERDAAQSRRPRQVDPGKVLRIGVTRVPTLDPAQARSVDQVLVADQLFDSLTTVDSTSFQPMPSLAERWQVSPDQKQWDFVLRPGAVFSNGRPITAEDVRYSLERVARPGSGSPVAEVLQLVSGYDPFRKNAAPGLAGVTAPAPNVVHVSLDQPWALLPTALSSPLFGVVAKESAEAQGPGPTITDEPVSSGPFQVGRQRGQTLPLVPARNTSTKLAGIDVVRFDEIGLAYQAFKNGDVDFVRVPADDITEAGRRYGRQGFRPYLAELFYGFNMKNPKFADGRFREAIVRGINRRAIVTAIYQGTVRPMDSPVLDGVGSKEFVCERCAHDPARSRALLQEVFNGGPPPPVALDYDDDATQDAIAKAIQASLAEVGIKVDLRPKAPRDYDGFALSNEPELFRLGWIANYPSPDAILPPLFGTDSLDNLTSFSNPAVDAMIRAARGEGDPGRRAQLFLDIERTVMEQLPVVPIAQFNVHSVIAKRAKGVELNSYGSFDATRVRVG
ncbi:MAG TPA: ABC transporter substrate-binding protein [Acidimicrobiales bacterium]|nr:ABC transporter substrate-binding protein [Acidimicrobiales bacterium]